MTLRQQGGGVLILWEGAAGGGRLGSRWQSCAWLTLTGCVLELESAEDGNKPGPVARTLTDSHTHYLHLGGSPVFLLLRVVAVLCVCALAAVPWYLRRLRLPLTVVPQDTRHHLSRHRSWGGGDGGWQSVSVHASMSARVCVHTRIYMRVPTWWGFGIELRATCRSTQTQPKERQRFDHLLIASLCTYHCTYTFAFDIRYLLHTPTAHTLRLAVSLAVDDDAVRGACGADHTAALSAVVLAVEGTELLTADHALLAEGVWDPYRTGHNRLVASCGQAGRQGVR